MKPIKNKRYRMSRKAGMTEKNSAGAVLSKAGNPWDDHKKPTKQANHPLFLNQTRIETKARNELPPGVQTTTPNHHIEGYQLGGDPLFLSPKRCTNYQIKTSHPKAGIQPALGTRAAGCPKFRSPSWACTPRGGLAKNGDADETDVETSGSGPFLGAGLFLGRFFQENPKETPESILAGSRHLMLGWFQRQKKKNEPSTWSESSKEGQPPTGLWFQLCFTSGFPALRVMPPRREETIRWRCVS